MLAKDKFREGWVRILKPLEFGESDEIIQPFSIMYAYFHKVETEYVLKPEYQERVNQITEIIINGNGGLFNNLSLDDKKGIFESKDDWVKRLTENRHFIETTKSFQEEVITNTILETYIKGKDKRIIPMRLLTGDYAPCSDDLFNEVFNGTDWMLKEVDSKYFNSQSSKDKIHYLRSRGISEERAKQMISGQAKDAVWYKPKEGILYNMCRPHHIIYGDLDYCKEFDQAMKDLPKKRSDELKLFLN